jgi:hypothetical protein
VIPEERRQRANGDRHWTAAIHIRVRRRVTCMAARRSREAAGVTLRLREAAGDFLADGCDFLCQPNSTLKTFAGRTIPSGGGAVVPPSVVK